jgi:alpha-glucoside transport system permease protein
MNARLRAPNITVGGLIARAALVFLIILWTIPTFGLLVSSLRDKDQLAVSGWWTALQTVNANARARTGNAEDQLERDGLYVIAGNILDEGDNRTIQSYGGGFLPGELTDYPPGDVLELEGGQTFVLHADGSYEWTSPQPFDLETGKSFFYISSNPPRFTLENYDEVLTSEGIGESFVNTLTVTIPSVLVATTVAAFAAYAFAWTKFPGRNLLFIVVVALLVVPLQMALIPVLRLYNGLGIAKTYPGIWLAHTGFGLPLAIFLLRNYIGSLPHEIIESAKMDGASDLQIFTRLVVPLSVPALAAYATFEFLWVWNDLLVALVFLSKRPDQIVLTSKLRELLGSRGDNWEILTSGAFVSLIVPLIVFFALQRYFVRGLTAGSVKA